MCKYEDFKGKLSNLLKECIENRFDLHDKEYVKNLAIGIKILEGEDNEQVNSLSLNFVSIINNSHCKRVGIYIERNSIAIKTFYIDCSEECINDIHFAIHDQNEYKLDFNMEENWDDIMGNYQDLFLQPNIYTEARVCYKKNNLSAP